ncbi:MAG: DUF1499 domain-containing protein [Proteobacteria bacterium]|nr:DUF1499 domain-containing protein [Pseudomonadota bacterium]
MTDQALKVTGGSRLASRVAAIGVGLAAIALIMLVIAPLGWRAGWWHFSVSFQYFLTWGAYVGAAAAVISLIAIVAALVAGGRRSVVLGAVGLIAGAVIAYVPWSYRQVTYVLPRIHDITTDTANPPTFSAVLPLRQAEKASPVAYEGDKVAADQKRAYPDIAPVTTALAPAEAFNRALDSAKALGWTIVASEPAQGRIEASQSSFWFGFTDDVVIRVVARADGQPGSRIDIRSVSRQGRHDFGVNAARIRAYTAKLKQQPGI